MAKTKTNETKTPAQRPTVVIYHEPSRTGYRHWHAEAALVEGNEAVFSALDPKTLRKAEDYWRGCVVGVHALQGRWDVGTNRITLTPEIVGAEVVLRPGRSVSASGAISLPAVDACAAMTKTLRRLMGDDLSYGDFVDLVLRLADALGADIAYADNFATHYPAGWRYLGRQQVAEVVKEKAQEGVDTPALRLVEAG